MKNRICKTCGWPISNISDRKGGMAFTHIMRMSDHRQIMHPTGVPIEQSPQLLINVSIFRNGGPGDDICQRCLDHALSYLKDEIEKVLSES